MTKIFHDNNLIGKFKCDGRKYSKVQILKMKIINFIKRFIFYTVVLSAFCGALYGAFWAGGMTTKPEIVEAKVEVIKEVEKYSFPKILEKICKAESGGRQFKDNGDVLRGIQNPSDIGYCQINEPIWNNQARKLGFDIYTLEGNKAMAKWIFENYGSEPWYLSKHNWKK